MLEIVQKVSAATLRSRSLDVFVLFALLAPCVAHGQTKPTIFVPAEKCPAYTALVQRYFTLRPQQTGALGCAALYDARAKLLSSMMAYGQNTACYSYGWKASEVTSFLQGLINRNQSERLRCQAWLASGRVCNDGRLCPSQTICNPERLCVPKPNATDSKAVEAKGQH